MGKITRPLGTAMYAARVRPHLPRYLRFFFFVRTASKSVSGFLG
jgi:hypothetical protein